MIENHDDPIHSGWKSWCRKCEGQKAEVERLTGIYGDWTESEKRGTRISEKIHSEISEMASKGPINYSVVARNFGISKSSVYRLSHRHRKQNARDSANQTESKSAA